MHDFSWLAVIVAAFSSFLVGGLWYSPVLFGKTWMVESGYKEENAEHPAKVFGLSFIFSVVAAIAYGVLVGRSPETMMAIHYALLASVCVAMSFGINYQFSSKSFTLFFIDAGYHTCQFFLYALVFIWLG